MNQREQELFDKATDTIKRQQAKLEELTAPAYPVGTVVAVFERSLVVQTTGNAVELERPQGVDKTLIGRTVDLHPQTGQIVRVSDFATFGASGIVTQIEGDAIQVSAAQGII